MGYFHIETTLYYADHVLENNSDQTWIKSKKNSLQYTLEKTFVFLTFFEVYIYDKNTRYVLWWNLTQDVLTKS